MNENSSMLLGMMGVVATQHIREEYDEDTDYDEEDEDESQEDNGFGGLQIVGETPPVNEGGGPSSGALNTHGNGGYHTSTTGNNRGMAVGEVVLNQRFKTSHL